ncbi:hypothetical protein [Actinokineospora auranticolor]|nr:hypothetical protein [Actinokineospora auranticolor]
MVRRPAAMLEPRQALHQRVQLACQRAGEKKMALACIDSASHNGETTVTLTAGLIAAASDMTSERVLAWSVYETILRTAEATSSEIHQCRRLHERAHEQRLLEAILPEPHERAQIARKAMLRLESLHTITTEADFIRSLRDKARKQGLSLRDCEKRMRELDPGRAVSKSTVGVWLKGDRIPRDTAGLTLLL